MSMRFNTPVFRPQDNKGRTLPGAQLFFYENYSTTPKTTYANVALTNPNPHPIIADGAGKFTDIFLGIGDYRVILTDKNGQILWDRNDVSVNDLTEDVINDIERQLDEVLNQYRMQYLGKYGVADPDLEKTFTVPNAQYVEFNGFAYWTIPGTTLPYTTDSVTYPDPASDPNLTIAPNVTFTYVDNSVWAGDSRGADGLIFPQDQTLLELGAQSTVVNINATRFSVNTGALETGELLYLWEPSGTLPAPPFTITNISTLNIGGYLFTIDGNDYDFVNEENLEKRLLNIIDGWGAIPLDDAACNAALIAAMNYQPKVQFPAVPIGTPWLFSGDIQLIDGVKLIGLGGRPELSLEDASYIQFTENSSWLTGEKASPSDRIKVNAVDLYLIGKDGPGVVASVGSGIAFDGSMGGRLDRCTFDGLEKGVENPWSFFMTYSDIDVRFCDFGLDINDANACVIEKFFATGTRRPIRGGADSARLVLRDIGINMSPQTEIGIECDGGIVFDGYTYFESFGGATPADQTAIRYKSTQFSGRTAVLQDILIDNASGGMAYGLDLAAVNDATTNIKGIIQRIKFAGTFSGGKIGQAVWGGFPRLTLPVDVESCPGLETSDVPASTNPRIPLTASSTANDVDISAAAFTNIPIDDSVTFDNQDSFSVSPGNYRVRRSGLYKITCRGSLTNTTASQIRAAEIRLTVDAVSTGAVITTVPIGTGGDGYAAFSLDLPPLELTSAQTITLQARNGDLLRNALFGAEYLSRGE